LFTGCRSLGFTVLGFDRDGPESDAESVVDSESDDESDDASEEDDEDDENEDEEDEGERFLFLSTEVWE